MNHPAPVRPPRDGGTEWLPATSTPTCLLDAQLEVVYVSGYRGFGPHAWHQLNEERGERVAWWRVATVKPDEFPKPTDPGEWLQVASRWGHAVSDDAMVAYVGGDTGKGMHCLSTMRKARSVKAVWFRVLEVQDDTPAPTLTGKSSDYYLVQVPRPARGGPAVQVECLDVIEALGMTFNEGEAFKAIWRGAAARKGNGKPGTTALYDAEKVAFYGGRMVAQAK